MAIPAVLIELFEEFFLNSLCVARQAVNLSVS